MIGSNNSQPVGRSVTGHMQPQTLCEDDLSHDEQVAIKREATKIASDMQQHLPTPYSVSTVAGTSQQGVVLSIQVFYREHPVAGANIPINNINLQDTNTSETLTGTTETQTESVTDMAKRVIASAILNMYQNTDQTERPRAS